MPRHVTQGDTLAKVNVTSPANNDVLTYKTTSGTWVNAPSSGSGGTYLAGIALSLVSSTFNVNTDGTSIDVDVSNNLRRKALTGDVTSPTGSAITTLATVNTNVGSFGSSSQTGTFTVNGKGLITAAINTTITPAAIGAPSGSGTSSGTNTGDQTITLTGDVTGSGTSSFVATLASIITAGSVGSSTSVPVLTYDAKGRLTAVTSATISSSAPTQRTFAYFAS